MFECREACHEYYYYTISVICIQSGADHFNTLLENSLYYYKTEKRKFKLLACIYRKLIIKTEIYYKSSLEL